MKRSRLAAAVLAALVLPAVHAEGMPDWLQVSGFGTMGVFKADDPVATVRADSRVSTGSNDKARFDQDSLLALQLNIRPGGPFNAGFQFISKKDIESTNKPRVQWAYVGWEPTSELNFKLGRSVAATFLMSDYRDLYYSQITARPHGTVYYNNAITYNDGLTGQWERNMGEGTLAVEGYYGKTGVSVAQGKVEVPKQMSLSAKWLQGPWTFRIAAGRADVDFEPTPGGSAAQLLDALKKADGAKVCGNCSAVVASRFKVMGIAARTTTIGFAFDNDAYVLQGEYTHRRSDSIMLGASAGWYLLGAKRMGEFTPYLVLGHLGPKNEPIGLTLTPPAAPNAAQQALMGAINIANATNISGQFDRDQHALGLRWDFYKNMALKAQWDYYKVKNPRWGSGGTVAYNMNPGAPLFDGRVNAYTLNLDFIF